ncbi:MAG: ribosome maturation factor RimP [Clostridia bacterium]|nr:ribosome maturation factor RimP [Clostridia bacterium]MBQ4145840.1 ribosome maturation factor RimP [Clostridia bacterium]
MANKVEEIVEKLAEKVAHPLGIIIYDVEFKKEGSEYFLRVYIDREESAVSIDDCEAVSRPLSDLLDEEDPIQQAYYLEVSSPGLERKLKKQRDFDRFIGENVNVSFYGSYEGNKNIIGKLGKRNDSSTQLELEDGNIIEIPNEKISSVRLTIDF